MSNRSPEPTYDSYTFGNPPEIHLIHRYHHILFVHNINFRNLILLKFYTDNSSHITMFSHKFHKEWEMENQIMSKKVYATFEFEENFTWISYMQWHWRLAQWMPYILFASMQAAYYEHTASIPDQKQWAVYPICYKFVDPLIPTICIR